MRIEDWRAQIDEVDNELLRLLNRRARLAARIGGMKSRAGLPLYDPDREREVLARACRANAGPLDEGAVARIFRRIMLQHFHGGNRRPHGIVERAKEVA